MAKLLLFCALIALLLLGSLVTLGNTECCRITETPSEETSTPVIFTKTPIIITKTPVIITKTPRIITDTPLSPTETHASRRTPTSTDSEITASPIVTNTSIPYPSPSKYIPTNTFSPSNTPLPYPSSETEKEEKEEEEEEELPPTGFWDMVAEYRGRIGLALIFALIFLSAGTVRRLRSD